MLALWINGATLLLADTSISKRIPEYEKDKDLSVSYLGIYHHPTACITRTPASEQNFTFSVHHSDDRVLFLFAAPHKYALQSDERVQTAVASSHA
jgi:hypothetical protein